MGRSTLDHGVSAADRAERFISKLTHTGDYAGVPFRLRPWQAEPIRRLFGTLRPDGTRQYRKTFWALPRKQGKTEVIAAGGLYLLMGQGRGHQRIYTASGDKDQASLIFHAMTQMIRANPTLEAATVIYDGYRKILFPSGDSQLEVLSRVPESKHGLGPTAVLIDEFHVVNPELVDVLTTGFGARKDPLTWMITTAGYDRTSICWDEWQYALQVQDGTRLDPTYLPVVYAADPEDDWRAESTWRKAMPALGDFCSLQFIREECAKAEARPRFENTFKRLYLNLWTEAAARWLKAEAWAACGTLGPAEREALKGRPCYAGLDLGISGDMTALALVVPNSLGGVDVRVRYWIPRDGKWRDEEHSRIVYPIWARAGWLTMTDGVTVNLEQVEAEIVAEDGANPFKLLLADRAYAKLVLNRLFNHHGINVQEVTQGPVTLNEPMVRLETMVAEGTLRHDQNPVLGWNVANACVSRSRTGLMCLDKASTTLRIDGLAALLDALVGVVADPQARPTIYKTRKVTFI